MGTKLDNIGDDLHRQLDSNLYRFATDSDPTGFARDFLYGDFASTLTDDAVFGAYAEVSDRRRLLEHQGDVMDDAVFYRTAAEPLLLMLLEHLERHAMREWLEQSGLVGESEQQEIA